MDEEGQHHTLPTTSLQESNAPSQCTINHPVKGNEHTRSRSERVRTPAGGARPRQGPLHVLRGRARLMGVRVQLGVKNLQRSGQAKGQPEVRTRPRAGWERGGSGSRLRWGNQQALGWGAGRAQVAEQPGGARVTAGAGGAGQAGHQQGRREYLGASPPPGPWTPVLPAHLLPPRVRTLSIYQKAREKRHVTQ